jgi:hypothetical protein
MKAISFTLFFTGLLLLFCASNLLGQVTYGYDAAGNRISRSIVMQNSSLRTAVAGEEEEESTVYSEILSEIQVKIYPNPTTGLIRIEIQNLSAEETADIALYQLSGKLITSKRTSGSTELDITGQPVGTYLLKIVAGKAQTEWKIIKNSRL